MTLFKRIEEYGKENRQIPAWIRAVIVVPPIALAIYWNVTESGLFYWLANVQADLFDGYYYIALTWLLTLLICLIPALIIVILIRPFFVKKTNSSDEGTLDDL